MCSTCLPTSWGYFQILFGTVALKTDLIAGAIFSKIHKHSFSITLRFVPLPTITVVSMDSFQKLLFLKMSSDELIIFIDSRCQSELRKPINQNRACTLRIFAFCVQLFSYNQVQMFNINSS